MSGRYLVELADVLRAGGLLVVEVDGWQTRARKSGGYADGPRCVMWHHTASNTTPENDVAYICRNADDAPLANLYLARTGEVWVCAAGATNTNGKGQATPTSKGTVPADSMNTHAIGIEAANSGVGQSWPQVQVDAYFVINNALAAAYGLQPSDCCSHHAYAPDRKIDPATAAAVEGPWRPGSVTTSGTWSVFDIRAEAERRAEPPPTPTPPTPTPGEDIMNYYVIMDANKRIVANAKFIGFPPLVRWTGPGDDKMTEAFNTQIAAGNLTVVELTGGPMAFKDSMLDGPLPTGDSLYTWTGEEFSNTAQIRAGQT